MAAAAVLCSCSSAPGEPANEPPSPSAPSLATSRSTPQPAPSGDATPAPTAEATSSPAPAGTCTGRAGEEALRGFFRDLSRSRPVQSVLAAYVVPPRDFVRWWDHSLPQARTLTFEVGLEQHLGKLQRNGVDLTVTGVKDAGFQGGGTRDAGGWFTFSLQGRLQRSEPQDEQSFGGKGAVDCDTGKLKAVVIG